MGLCWCASGSMAGAVTLVGRPRTGGQTAGARQQAEGALWRGRVSHGTWQGGRLQCHHVPYVPAPPEAAADRCVRRLFGPFPTKKKKHPSFPAFGAPASCRRAA